ncbi:MAG: hypothetical protein E7505_07520, partial [Ruminococcus sp.]|nr:hypothetical protein [Ruminococcus sp.]
MSRKFRKAVASTLALAMLAGTASSMPSIQYSIVQAAETGATLTVNAPKTVKPGEEFSVTVDITNNADGFSGLIAWLNYDKSAFELVEWEAGGVDEDDPIYNLLEANLDWKNPDVPANIATIVQIYFDAECQNYKGDAVFSKMKFKVKEDAASGNYNLDLDDVSEPEKAKQNRIIDGKVIACTPKFVDASITVEGGTTSVDPPASSAETTQAPATNGLSASIANASGAVNEKIKTTLNVSSNPSIAGFTASLSYDTSSLKFVSASASGWDIEASADGKQIVALANPYADNKSATVDLVFEGTASGSHKVSISALEGATKGEQVVNGTGTAGTITVSGSGDVSTNPPQVDPPSADAIQFVVGEIAGNAGETVTVPISIKNNTGIAAAQFTYKLDGGLKISRVNKGELGGSWTHSEPTNGLQFLTSDGENVTDDDVLGKLRVEIPEGTPDGTYYITLSDFEATSYDPATDKHTMIETSKLAGVVGKVVVGNPTDTTPEPVDTTKPADTTPKPVDTTKPADTPNVNPPSADAIQFVVGEIAGNAGETVTVPLSVKNNTGIAAAQFTYKLDGGLKISRVNKGELGGSWTHSEPTNGLQFLTSDGENVTDDDVLGKLRIEIPEGTPDGTYYITLSDFEATSYDPATDKHTMIETSKLAGVV